jgi:two-component system nitrogen regulation response regulator GlnG
MKRSTTMPRLLVVDDEPNVLYSLQTSLQSDALEVAVARTARAGIEMVRHEPVDAVVLDVRLPDMSGLDAFRHIQEIDARLPVIIITAFAATDTAIEAMKRGAFEYLLKPIEFRRLRDVVTRAIELSRLRHVPAVFEETEVQGGVVDRIVGQSAAMQEVYKAIGRAAPQDITVLILGESGTGKELVARALYHHSRRKDGSFLALNCAAIPDTLLESELFGHERGAFTGAERRRIGKFEQANGGTLFLDEIGDMPASAQAKMLRLLQERQFERLGGSQTIETDVRIIAATNQNLEEQVAGGQFREDLYYRLKVATIHVPPLRDRLDDLRPLVEHFLARHGPELGKNVRSVLPETLERLAQHPWAGNIRELQNTIKEALLRTTGEVLTPDSLPEKIGRAVPPDEETGQAPVSVLGDLVQRIWGLLEAGETDVYRKIWLELDRIILETTLRYTKGNQVQASEMLGIARSTLRTRLRQLGLAPEKRLPGEGEETSEGTGPPA